MLEEFLMAFVALFIILDPFASLPVFITLTAKLDEKKKSETADKAIIIAGILAVVFALVGLPLLNAIGTSLGSFKVAGGIVLGLMGLETVLGIHSKNEDKSGEGIAVLIATPLLTGPGMLTTLIVLIDKVGYATALAACAAALFVAWVVLKNAFRLNKLVGQQTINVSSKVFGLLLIALGIEFIKTGLVG